MAVLLVNIGETLIGRMNYILIETYFKINIVETSNTLGFNVESHLS